ncbi:hypothetical protein KBD34_03030 [Patescibacteria group bacterium]|nr:hypothetical protein [Patescibacteria group bacterium]
MSAPAVQQDTGLPFGDEVTNPIHVRYLRSVETEVVRAASGWYRKEAVAHRAIHRLHERCKGEGADIAQCLREIKEHEQEIEKYKLAQTVLLGFQSRQSTKLGLYRAIEGRARRSLERRRESAVQGEYGRRFKAARAQLTRDDLADIQREMQFGEGVLAEFLKSQPVRTLVQRWLLELSGLPLPAEREQ